MNSHFFHNHLMSIANMHQAGGTVSGGSNSGHFGGGPGKGGPTSKKKDTAPAIAKKPTALPVAAQVVSIAGMQAFAMERAFRTSATHTTQYGMRDAKGFARSNLTMNRVNSMQMNAAAKGAARVGHSLGIVGVGITVIDGISSDNWTNTHTADLSIQSALLVASFYAVPGVGWIALGYTAADIGWQVYTGNTITQSIFEKK